MKSRSLIVLALLAGSASAAAQTAPSSPPPQATPAPLESNIDAGEQDLSPASRHCLRETGTRIRVRAEGGRRCSPASGRVWTREDLERTGHVDLADALRTLDVSIR